VDKCASQAQTGVHIPGKPLPFAVSDQLWGKILFQAGVPERKTGNA
jgi:hypothetical protein